MSGAPQLGKGFYTATDASQILRIPFQQAKDWFQYYVKHRLFDTVGFRYYFEISDAVAVDFLTLITMAVFFGIKKDNKDISTQGIVRAHKEMAKQLKTPYPFASQDIWTGGKSIFYGSEDFLIRAETGAPTIPFIYEGYAHKIEFDDKRIAHKFYPLGKEKSIVVNPENQFGLPTIVSTNILTDTVFDMISGGVKKDEVCKSFDISLQTVNDVIEFHKKAA